MKLAKSFFLFLLIIPFYSISQIVYKTWPNGNKKYEVVFVDSLKLYKESEWHDNGQLRDTHHFNTYNGLPYDTTKVNYTGYKRTQGDYIRYYKNGQKEYEGHFEKGIANGLFTEWHENGQKKSESLYKNDNTEGKSWKWHPNGVVAEEGLYDIEEYDFSEKIGELKSANSKRKVPLAERKYWDDKGSLIKIELYKRLPTKTYYYESGKLVKIEFMRKKNVWRKGTVRKTKHFK